MSNTNASRILGDDYQAMVFWKYVNQMIRPDSDIEKIGYEFNDVKSFDDIVIFYKNPQKFRDSVIMKDYIQVKFHMRQTDKFTINNLLNPKFINAKKNSLLDNIKSAYEQLNSDFDKARFIVYSLWDIDQSDELYRLINNREETFELPQIFDGTKTYRSTAGKIRKTFCDALSVTEDELYKILRQICIYSGRESIVKLQENLNTEFSNNGLKPCSNSSDVNPYIEMNRSWIKCGVKEFNREFILEQCKMKHLIVSDKKKECIAVRSFLDNTKGIIQRANDVLDLSGHFDGRFLKQECAWEEIDTEIKLFTESRMRDDIEYNIELRAHLSIAFMLGRHLNSKTGIRNIPVQNTVEGNYSWNISVQSDDKYQMLEKNEQRFCDKIYDMGIAISITKPIKDSVEEYIEHAKIPLGRLYHLILPQTGQNAVKNGEHGWKLAEQIDSIIVSRSREERKGVLHIFISAPWAVVFYLGKMSLSYGKIQMYEYDFEGKRTGTYYPSVSFSIN